MVGKEYFYLVLHGQVPFKLFTSNGNLCAWLNEQSEARLDALLCLRMQQGGDAENNLRFVPAMRVLDSWRKRDA